MKKKLLTFFFKNLKLIGLIFLIILTVIIAAYSNQKNPEKLNIIREELKNYLDKFYDIYKQSDVLQYHFVFLLKCH